MAKVQSLQEKKTQEDNGRITSPLEGFRQGNDSESMRNALAEVAMRLLNAHDRSDFQKADGVTTIVDHLGRILEEQATLEYAWSVSNVFGTTTWEQDEVHDSLQLTLVALCHASIDSDIAAEMHELGLLETLFQLFRTLPRQLKDYRSFILECCRNLCIPVCCCTNLSSDFVLSMWDILFSMNETSEHCHELAAEVLTNIAAIKPSHTSATPAKLSRALSLLLQMTMDPARVNVGIALSDLMCNLCCDDDYCLLLICELDTRRPRESLKHSGVVYLAELTEGFDDNGLKSSMEALVHNLSSSNPVDKRSIQKLGVSSYMHRFRFQGARNTS